MRTLQKELENCGFTWQRSVFFGHRFKIWVIIPGIQTTSAIKAAKIGYEHLISMTSKNLRLRNLRNEVICLAKPLWVLQKASRLSFEYFLMFIPIWGNDPIWLIFFRWVVRLPTSYFFFGGIYTSSTWWNESSRSEGHPNKVYFKRFLEEQHIWIISSRLPTIWAIYILLYVVLLSTTEYMFGITCCIFFPMFDILIGWILSIAASLWLFRFHVFEKRASFPSHRAGGGTPVQLQITWIEYLISAWGWGSDRCLFSMESDWCYIGYLLILFGGQLSRKLSSVPWALFICMVSVMSN